MYAARDQLERDGQIRFKLEDTIELFGPGDFVGREAPGKTADASQMQCFLGALESLDRSLFQRRVHGAENATLRRKSPSYFGIGLKADDTFVL